MEEGWVVSKDWVGSLFIAIAYHAGSIPISKKSQKKNPTRGGVFLLTVLSVGIEPTSQAPQASILSIERREQIRRRASLKASTLYHKTTKKQK